MSPAVPSKFLLTLALLTASATASAHVGHGCTDIGFAAGFTHPFTGLDHLAAMLAVGVWSAMTTRRIWVAPVSFASLLLVGALLGVAGVTLPAVEPMIAVSLLVIGLLLMSRAKLPLAAGATLVGAFALFHGLAHGGELGCGATEATAAALIGMTIGTALIHIAGLLFGRQLLHAPNFLSRALGGIVSLFGAGLLAGVF